MSNGFFSEETLDICISFWTAGQRSDPSTESQFIWKTGSQELAMTYTNWNTGQPDYSGQTEACMHLKGEYAYKWNDAICTVTSCAICEIDM